MLFELLSGASAFGGRRSLVAGVERAVSGMPPAPLAGVVTDQAAAARGTNRATLGRTLSGDLATIVAKALAHEPERRYASVQHMVARRRIEVAAAVVAVAALVGGLMAAIVQARRAEAEARKATEVTRFLTTMLGSAAPGELGRDVTVREVLAKAMTEADALDATPQLASAVRGVIGETLIALGDFDAAVQQLTRAVAAERAVAPSGSAETVRLLTSVSHAHENAGRLDEAAKSLDEATAAVRRLSTIGAEDRATYLDQLGRVRAAQGQFEKAREALAEAHAFVRAENLGPEIRSNAAGNLAFVLANLGRYREAKPLYEEAIEDARLAAGSESNLVADILSPYATVLWFVNERESALSVYEETIRIRRRTLGPEHPNYAVTLLNYADSLVVLERYDRAVPLLREILALRGKTLPDTHQAIAAAMMSLGRALGPLGQLEEAERSIREGIAIRERMYEQGDWRIASARSILGGHLVLARRFAEAEPMLLDAERQLSTALGNESAVVADARRRLVGLYTALNRPDEAARWQNQLANQTP